MKHVFALAVLLMSIAPAHAKTTEVTQHKWYEQIFQIVIGTPVTETNPKITHTTIKRNYHHRNGHRHASTIQKSLASAGDMKYLAHINKEQLFQEFEDWKWFQLTHQGGVK